MASQIKTYFIESVGDITTAKTSVSLIDNCDLGGFYDIKTEVVGDKFCHSVIVDTISSGCEDGIKDLANELIRLGEELLANSEVYKKLDDFLE